MGLTRSRILDLSDFVRSFSCCTPLISMMPGCRQQEEDPGQDKGGEVWDKEMLVYRI